MKKGFIFLTSTGLSLEPVAQKLKDLFSDHKNHSVAIVTTASEEKENSKYAQLAKKQFREIGFLRIDFVDLEFEPSKDFSKYDIIYVCGGNTFKLLRFSREANFKASVENLLNRSGVYIGVSAGSVLVGPSIAIAGEVAADRNDIGLKDFAGFGITDLIVLPHYSTEIEGEASAFEKRYSVKIERLSNSQAMFIAEDKNILLE